MLKNSIKKVKKKKKKKKTVEKRKKFSVLPIPGVEPGPPG